MKKLACYISIAVLGIAFAISEATANEKEIMSKSQSDRTDVFSEVKDEGMPPKGFVDLVIKASIKTHLEGYYILESRESLHGKQGYPFLINIDGQAAIWKIDGLKDTKPPYDKDGKTNPDPESGEGVKYFLEKKVRLTAGSHRIFFGLPEENYSKNFDITLKEDEVYVLEFKPTYKYKTRPYRIPTFLKGIKHYTVSLYKIPDAH